MIYYIYLVMYILLMPAHEKTFKRYDPDQTMLMPTDMREWLPEDHLAYFISDIVEEMDLSAFYARYKPAPGCPPYDPKMMLKVIIYAYCIGMRSSRQIKIATKENVAFRILAAGNFPDFRTICRFRVDHAESFHGVFRQVLQLCTAEGLVKMQVVAVDGTKLKANANVTKNRRKNELEDEAEYYDRVARRIIEEAENVDADEDEALGEDDGNPLPPDMRRRDGRRQRIAESLRQIKEEERIEDRRRREEEEAAKGKKVRGRKPKLEKKFKEICRNPSDPDSRVMMSSNGFVQSYNAQIVVDCDSQVIIAEEVVQDCNDEQQLVPMLKIVEKNTGRSPEKGLGDAGYYSDEAIRSLKHIDLYVATQMSYDDRMGVPLRKRKRAPSLREEMAAKLRTEEGHALFARRSRTVETAFGNIKENRGLRRFLVRGLRKVRGEWTLACIGHNLKKLWFKRSGSSAILGKNSTTAAIIS